MAKLTFYGATDRVTGSAYLLETASTSILLECGLVQGTKAEEKENDSVFPFNVENLDAVILSHAHLDHSGRLPKLVKDGFDGPVFMTYPTSELLEIMLKDAAFLQLRDAEWENKRRLREGKKEILPLFTLEDVEKSLLLCQGVKYDLRFRLSDDVEVCFRDAGHILGSAIVEIYITERAAEKKLVFSGDLGNSCAALLRDPESIKNADVLLMESTYGDREHRSMHETLQEFEDIIDIAAKNGGNILIPSFAVGRTQEIIFRLGEIYKKGKLKQQAVYLDSPMAIATTEVYHRFQGIFNEEDRAVLKQSRSGSLHTLLPILRYSRTTEESIALNRISEGAIIIAGSGMCNGGRIRHHLKHNLWRKAAHVLMVGYQAIGTPGRALVDGTKYFRIGGDRIAVKATIHTLGGFSAHASQSQLLNWADKFDKPRPRLYLIHGESKAKVALENRFSKMDWPASLPHFGETIVI